MKIACVGDNCVDFYDATGETHPGGNPVNVAVYTSRLGGAASYTGAVGTDENGRLMLEALRGKGVDVSHVQVKPGATALTHVSLVNGDRVFGGYEEGVLKDFRLSEDDVDFLCGHDLVVSGLWGMVERDLSKIKARGVPVAFDCATRPDDEAARIALPSCDVAFFSDDESGDETLQEKLRAVAAQGPRVVVATRGEKGSLAWDGRTFTPYGIVACPVVDTMGAGDSYIAGFLNSWLGGAPIPACMGAGALCSAVTLGMSGAW